MVRRKDANVRFGSEADIKRALSRSFDSSPGIELPILWTAGVLR